jgi:hypothetical protein
LESYNVTSVPQRGKQQQRQRSEEGYYIFLLLDGKSGLGKYNQFKSGNGSLPDENSTYDDITHKTAHLSVIT